MVKFRNACKHLGGEKRCWVYECEPPSLSSWYLSVGHPRYFGGKEQAYGYSSEQADQLGSTLQHGKSTIGMLGRLILKLPGVGNSRNLNINELLERQTGGEGNSVKQMTLCVNGALCLTKSQIGSILSINATTSTLYNTTCDCTLGF